MAGAVIIGAGECGVRAAFTLRDEGYEGDITLLSAESAMPYERPPLSKAIPVEAKPIRSEKAYRDARIDLRLGVTVTALDTVSQNVTLSDGEALGYDRCLIATGARARLFPTLAGCLTLRTLSDAQRILGRIDDRSHLGIIGGGFIGLELAATARAVGATVTLIEGAPRLMARAVPQAIAAIVEARHRAEGVHLRLGASVASADATTITLNDGETLTFDMVVAGVGASPDTALAEAAGLDCADGILVDATFRTSAPGVWAAGDCCRFPWLGDTVRLESWRVAQDQGAHAARAMLGADDSFVRHPWFWSDQYDLTLQVAGLFDTTRDTVCRDLGDTARLVFQQDDACRLTAAAGIGPGLAIAKDIKLAERLIERGATPPANQLTDPTINLKQLLKAA